MMSTDETQLDAESPRSEGVVGRPLTRRPVRIVGVVIAAGVIAVLNGTIGLAIGGVVVAVGLVTAPPVAFGAGVAGLLISPEIDPVLHCRGPWTPRSPRRSRCGNPDWSSNADGDGRRRSRDWGRHIQRVGSLVTAAVTVGLVLSVALIMYAIHRYERVTLGLVSDSPDQ